MFCGKCGAEVLDGAKFCEKCGATVERDVTKKEQIYVEKTNAEHRDIKSEFIDSDEQLIEKIGNGFFSNFLFDKIKECNLYLTNKRVYLKGRVYSGGYKNINVKYEERIVDVKDITGTGFIYDKISWVPIVLDIIFTIAIEWLVWAVGPRRVDIPTILCIYGPIAIIAIGLAVASFMSRKTFFFIDYAGGRIMIDAKLIGIEDVRDFHKQMRRVKDNIKGETP